MKNRLLLALAFAGSSFAAGAPAFAGHMFTQGSTNTPVWLQEGQGVFVEQYYSNETASPGSFQVWFDPFYSGDYYGDDPTRIPAAADTTDPEWYAWNVGDVVEVKITTATGDMTWTLAYDQDDGSGCAYTVCGFGYNSGAASNGSSTSMTGSDIPDFTAWGTYLPEITTIDTNTDSGLSLAEIQAAGTSGMGSLSPYLFGADGTADPATAFASADANSDGVVTLAEMGDYVWNENYNVFSDVETLNGEPSGVLNQYGITFTALSGDFTLTGYRIADASGYQLHGSGSGPVDQTSVCTPPNCGPDASGLTQAGTTTSIERVTVVVDQALRQANQVMVAASEQEIDVNFSEASAVSVSSKGLSISTSGAPAAYRFAARAEGSFERNSSLGDLRTGSFVVAYAVQPELDVGIYGSVRAMDLNFRGYSFDGNTTALGVYLRKRADNGLGLQWKLSIGASYGSADITRAAGVDGAEAGSGNADLRGQVASFELGYGQKLGTALVTPFGRLTHSRMTRGGYTETVGTSPLTFGSYSQNLTTLTLGMKAEQAIDDKTRIAGGVFVARDLARSGGSITGSSAVSGLSSFDFGATDASNATRFGANVSLYHNVTDDSRIYTRIDLQQASHVATPSVSMALGFETRF